MVCKYAADNKITVICLPSHTTHALQPCDVGAFGLLAQSWKWVVTLASQSPIAIRKDNLLSYYHTAQIEALKPSTIQSAFRKTSSCILQAIKKYNYTGHTTTSSNSPTSSQHQPKHQQHLPLQLLHSKMQIHLLMRKRNQCSGITLKFLLHFQVLHPNKHLGLRIRCCKTSSSRWVLL